MHAAIPISLLVKSSKESRRLWTVLGVGLAYFIFLCVKPVRHEHVVAVADILYVVLPALAGGWVFLDCWRKRRRAFAPAAEGASRWRAAMCLGMGSFSYGIGSVIWAYYELCLGRECPFPSWADAGFLLSYPFLFLGVLLLPNRPLPPALRWRVLLDSVMTMTALVTFSWYFILGPVILAGSETKLGMILGAAYPCGDLIALFCLLVLTEHIGERSLRRVTRLLICGVFAVVAADVPFGYLTLHKVYVTGSISDTGWVVGWPLIALSGCALLESQPAKAALKTEDINKTAVIRNPVVWRAMMPYALAPCVAALLVYMLTHNSTPRLETGVYIGSALLIGLVLLRQVFALLENNNLNKYLREAYYELELKNRQLHSLATTDGMTGLSNHRSFQERLRIALADSQRHGGSLSLLLLDVDHFKSYNDSFGHPAGDEILRQVASLLRGSIREGDLAARYGGEEFAVLLPGADSEQARATAERIRAAVGAHEFPNRRITVSIGVTDLDIAGADPETLIASADTALYAAKHTGRNCWVVADKDAETLVNAA